MLLYDFRDILVINLLIDVAVHQSPAIIILDVSFVLIFRYSQILGKSLLFKIFHSMIICISKEIINIIIFAKSFEDVH